AARHHAGRRPPGLHHRPGRPGAVPGGRADRRRRRPPRPGRLRARLRRARPRLRGGPRVTAPAGPPPDAADPDAARPDPAAEVLALGALDAEPALGPASPDEVHVLDAGAVEVLRRGLAVTPELRQGVAVTLVMATATAAGKLAVPVLIQQILDRGVLGPAGF